MLSSREKIHDYLERVAPQREHWKRKNRFYYSYLEAFIAFLVPPDGRVLELGSGTGDLLHRTQPSSGLGLDISATLVSQAQKKYPDLKFQTTDMETTLPEVQTPFDTVILSDTLGYISDIEGLLRRLHPLVHDRSRLIITQYNHLWEPLLELASTLKLRMPSMVQHWLSGDDMENLLHLAGFQVIKRGTKMLCPIYIPLISVFLNRFLANIPPFSHLGLVNYIVATPTQRHTADLSVSVVVPARNEAGMIERIVKETPRLGTQTELIFVEGNSTDDTWAAIERAARTYQGPLSLKIARQEGKGKGDAVRKGFDMATGDILMIYDADMTVPPEELEKFYAALAQGRGDFINGSRLVYPMEAQSMRLLNYAGNKFFSFMFSWLLGQRIKDTLCGTKVLRRSDYEQIKKNRAFFGDFDPFGDFDLLFGAAKLNLKIIDLPVHYRERVYGMTNISRWSHGWLLLKMVAFAARKIKFI